MLGVLIGLGFIVLFCIPIFMVVCSAVIVFGWWKGARDRKRAALESAKARRVGLV